MQTYMFSCQQFRFAECRMTGVDSKWVTGCIAICATLNLAKGRNSTWPTVDTSSAIIVCRQPVLDSLLHVDILGDCVKKYIRLLLYSKLALNFRVWFYHHSRVNTQALLACSNSLGALSLGFKKLPQFVTYNYICLPTWELSKRAPSCVRVACAITLGNVVRAVEASYGQCLALTLKNENHAIS